MPTRSDGKVTFEFVVEAAARVLDKGGPDALNTNEIARVAGTSVGTVYRYFPNKHAITAALIEHTQRELLVAFQTALAREGGSLRETIHDIVLALADVYSRRRTVHRFLFEAIGKLGLGDVYAARMQRYVTVLTPFLQGHPEYRLGAAHAARAATLVVYTAEGFAFNVAHRASAVEPELAADLAAMYAGYLTGASTTSGSAARGSSPRRSA